MIKVMHLISSMNIGGAETMVKDYALLMDKNQFKVEIVTLDKHYDSPNEIALMENGIPIIHLSELHYSADEKLNVFQKIYRSLLRYYDLHKIIKEHKPDVLHAHLFIGHYLRGLSFKRRNIKLLYTVHNVPERFFDATGKDREKYSAYKEIKRLLKKQNLYLIALHDNMKSELESLFKTNHVITVNNGINLQRFQRELYDKTKTREKIGIPNKAFLVGHIGRFHEQKNHDLILDIFSLVWENNNCSYLLLVGEGPEKNRIEERISKSNFKDHVLILESRNDVPELLNSMDVFLFPSKWEGFGNVMLEAQSIGLHCVVSDKIPTYAIINKNVDVLSLDADLKVWTSCVEKKEPLCIPNKKIENYDMLACVLSLQTIYCKN